MRLRDLVQLDIYAAGEGSLESQALPMTIAIAQWLHWLVEVCSGAVVKVCATRVPCLRSRTIGCMEDLPVLPFYTSGGSLHKDGVIINNNRFPRLSSRLLAHAAWHGIVHPDGRSGRCRRSMFSNFSGQEK